MILINPPFHRFSKQFINYLPLGISYIASLLKKNGFNVKIIDYDYCPEYFYPGGFVADRLEVQKVDFDNHPIWQKIRRNLARYPLDIVGIASHSTPQFKSTLSVAKIVKKINPKAIIIIGGAHATALAKDILSYRCIDIVTAGESEMTVLELAGALQKKDNLEGIKGIFFKKNGTIIDTGRRALIKNLDELPFPERQWFDLYGKRFIDKSNTIMTSRGCPYDCVFCGRRTIWEHRTRFRGIQNVVSEINYLFEKYKIKEFSFSDDCFVLNKDRTMKLCRLIRKQCPNIAWTCQTRGDLLDEEIVEEMKNSGCRRISIGLESGNSQILKKMNKKLNLEKIVKNSRSIKNKNILLKISIILGHPDETIVSLKDTENILSKIDPDITKIAFFTPFPGSKAYEDLKKENIIIEKDWWLYQMNNSNLIFKHRYLTKDILLRYHSRWSYLFNRKLIVKKIMRPRSVSNLFKLAILRPFVFFRSLIWWLKESRRYV